MWDNPRQLNAIALVVAFAARDDAGVGRDRVGRPPAGVRVSSGRHRRAAAARQSGASRSGGPRGAQGNVLHHAARRRALVAAARALGAARRAAPRSGRTASKWTVSEHEPLARWNDAALIDTEGEVFSADFDGELPQFTGPEGTRRGSRRAIPRLRRRARTDRARDRRDPALAARRLAAGRGRQPAVDDRARTHRAGRAPGAIRRLLPRDAGRAFARRRARRLRRPALSQRIRRARVGRQRSIVQKSVPGIEPHGQGQQEPHRRARHRHVEDRRDRRRGHRRQAAEHHRAGHAAVARAEEGRRRQHRGDDGVDPARARGSRADGRLRDHRGLHRHRRQPHPEPQLQRHGRDQGKGSHAGRHRPRHRDGQGDRDTERPAGAAHPAAGIHRRRPGRRARAAGHERRAARGESAHRHRRGVRGREHHQVRAPLRAARSTT